MLTKKAFLLFVIMLIAPIVLLPAQSKETLAVLDFTTEAVSEIEMNAIVEFLSAELFRTDKYIVIDVSQRETILQEMEFSMSGCSDDSCALEIGKMLSAELIVTGNLSKVGSRYLMSVKMLETETSRTMGTANGKYTDLDELIDGLETIAYTLAGKEDEVNTVTSTPEPEPVIEPLPAVADTKAETAETDPKAPAPEPEVAEKPDSENAAVSKTGDLNIEALLTAELGTILMTTGSLFSSFAINDRLAAEEAYSAYMSATVNPEYLYATDDDIMTYKDYYGLYERDTMATYIGSGTGAALSAVSGFMGNNISTGGKITNAAGIALSAAGNIVLTMAANNAIESRRTYNEYMSAGTDASAAQLWTLYMDSYAAYGTSLYSGYGLAGVGGLLSAASWFIPGEKTAATSGMLEKILTGVGYLCFAGGNFSKSIALNSRFNAEDYYEDYMSAGTADASESLYNEYVHYFDDYELFTYISYGLWGAGAAAIITGMFIPENTDTKTAEAGYTFAVRPTLTGLGVEVDIKLK